jgi:hypothetical protein
MTVDREKLGLREQSHHLRRADPAEAGMLAYLRLASLLCLEMRDEPLAAVHALIRALPDVDAELLASGRYFVAEKGGDLIGGAGWSMLPLSFRLPRLLDEQGRPAGWSLAQGSVLLRGLFLDPDMGRNGAMASLLARIEADVARAGHAALEVIVPASSQVQYRSHGFRPTGKFGLRLANEGVLPLARMRKGLSCRLAMAA